MDVVECETVDWEEKEPRRPGCGVPENGLNTEDIGVLREEKVRFSLGALDPV